MAQTTDIEWCDSTLNLQMGCDGCELWTGSLRNCYAGILTERYGGRKGWPESFDKPALFVERLKPAVRWPDLTGADRPDKPWLNGLPRMIFLNDMGDTFTESLPLDWLAPLLPAMADSPHQFMLLTKRASRMRKFSEQHPLPPNVWPGVSVTNQTTTKRIMDLIEVEGGGPKWLSVEPIVNAVDLRLIGEGRNTITPLNYLKLVVVGGESGPGSRLCNVEWLRTIRDQCRGHKTACFIKQVGSNPYDGAGKVFHWPKGDPSWISHSITDAHLIPKLRDKKGGDWAEWPKDLRVREFPQQEAAQAEQ